MRKKRQHVKKRKGFDFEFFKRKGIPSTTHSLYYQNQFENGLLQIQGNAYSKMYELGNLDYQNMTDEHKRQFVSRYSLALNSLGEQSSFQLLITNLKRGKEESLGVLLDYKGDPFDNYRSEVNEIIAQSETDETQRFEKRKFMILTNESETPRMASQKLNEAMINFEKKMNSHGSNVSLMKLDGQERCQIVAQITRGVQKLLVNYDEFLFSDRTTKDVVAPSKLIFHEDCFQMGEKWGRVLYIREYPKTLEDRLVDELCKTGVECCISIHGKAYEMNKVMKQLQNKEILTKATIIKQQKENFREGVNERYVSKLSMEVESQTTKLLKEIKENGLKLYSGLFSVFVLSESKGELEEATRKVMVTGTTWGVSFDTVYKRQEEGLNTILPFGKCYLSIEDKYMRDMTTANITTQIPFSNIEIQSETGHYYGRNSQSKRIISIDRKKDLITPSGLILGSSGSGKSVTVKWNLLMNCLTHPEDKVLIVDPESEYFAIGKELGAEILEISANTHHHLNILDLVDTRFLDREDRAIDVVKEKANLLSSLFETILKDFSDEEAGIVDRVTRYTYLKVKHPTLVDWHKVLSEQPEQVAKTLLMKVEPYTIGSQDIFSHPTNVNLSHNFVIFNIKNLDERMKPFAMKVIFDQIWKQVVQNQGKNATWMYFDELQLNFDTEDNASWFMKLWSRVRKYGGIPTGITQNVSTLLESVAGQKMISNTELIILLRQKMVDIQYLTKMMDIPPNLMKYLGDQVPQGTGLISSGGVIVPFENPIPKNTHVYELVST